MFHECDVFGMPLRLSRGPRQDPGGERARAVLGVRRRDRDRGGHRRTGGFRHADGECARDAADAVRCAAGSPNAECRGFACAAASDSDCARTGCSSYTAVGPTGPAHARDRSDGRDGDTCVAHSGNRRHVRVGSCAGAASRGGARECTSAINAGSPDGSASRAGARDSAARGRSHDAARDAGRSGAPDE